MAPPTHSQDKRIIETSKRGKRLREEVRVTPWKDRWELENTGRSLLLTIRHSDDKLSDDDFAKFQDAIETVSVWRARSAATKELPHAIESTALLAEVYWRDQIDAGNFVSKTELRLAYSSAIVRCINGFADSLQQQRFVAAPISTLCTQLGIPSWLVDIRHEASHNAMPTLPVLRLAAETLLNYLHNEYWIPMCPNLGAHPSDPDEEMEDDAKGRKAIDILLDYKKCSVKLATESTNSKETPKTPQQTKKEEQSSSLDSSRPFDTFFGNNDDESSSEEEEPWDPLLGSLWGNNIGSSNNRFAALQSTKKPKAVPKKKKKKKAKKPPPVQKRKKQPGEKFPLDYAREFVKTISPLEGYETAIQFLVWGGLGGAAEGRGALIPGSVAAFPANDQGINKCWQRFRPLLETLGFAWPGFCVSLLIHLVEFVLVIEASCVEANEEDAGSARKLFFLSAWIRLLLSEKFASMIYPGQRKSESGSNGKKVKRDNSTQLPLADFETLAEKMQYPLNSLCDRCCERVDHLELRATSQDIKNSLEDILGSHRVETNGIPAAKSNIEGAQSEETDSPILEGAHGPALRNGKTAMTLEEMEAFLADDKSVNGPTEEPENTMAKVNDKPSSDVPRQPWTLCTHWDPCALGTLPGHVT